MATASVSQKKFDEMKAIASTIEAAMLKSKTHTITWDKLVSVVEKKHTVKNWLNVRNALHHFLIQPGTAYRNDTADDERYTLA